MARFAGHFFHEEIMKTRMMMAVLLALPHWVGAQPAPDAESRSTLLLASNCANCHGTTGNAQGAMPNLAGLQKTYIVEQMRAFRDGKRPATIMHQLAKGYTDPQIEAIADFFSRQKSTR